MRQSVTLGHKGMHDKEEGGSKNVQISVTSFMSGP